MWNKIEPGVWNYATEMGVRYQEQISKVVRGKEYTVPLNKLKGNPVDFDGMGTPRAPKRRGKCSPSEISTLK